MQDTSKTTVNISDGHVRIETHHRSSGKVTHFRSVQQVFGFVVIRSFTHAVHQHHGDVSAGHVSVFAKSTLNQPNLCKQQNLIHCSSYGAIQCW